MVCGRDNVVCLFDLHVCYVFVLYLARCADETKSPKASDGVATRREKQKSVTLQQDVKTKKA